MLKPVIFTLLLVTLLIEQEIKTQWEERISKILNLMSINHDSSNLGSFTKKYFMANMIKMEKSVEIK